MIGAGSVESLQAAILSGQGRNGAIAPIAALVSKLSIREGAGCRFSRTRFSVLAAFLLRPVDALCKRARQDRSQLFYLAYGLL